MKLSWNLIAQVIGTVIQGGNAVTNILPAGSREVIAISVGILQGIVALMSHFRNTDGTPQTVAYKP